MLAFHGAGAAETFSLNIDGRPNQYDLWPGFADRASVGDHLILVTDEMPEPADPVPVLTAYFNAVRQGELVVLRRGSGEVRRRRLWHFEGWNGEWPGQAVNQRRAAGVPRRP